MDEYARVEPRPGTFVEPRVTDLGGLVELTRSSDLFFGHAMSGANDLGFSTAVNPNNPHSTVFTSEGTVGSASSGPAAGTSGSPGGLSGAAGAAGSGAGGGGQLPFTGYSVTIVAAMGSALSAAGVAIRRALGRYER
jgi:hypothetical protein